MNKTFITLRTSQKQDILRWAGELSASTATSAIDKRYFGIAPEQTVACESKGAADAPSRATQVFAHEDNLGNQRVRIDVTVDSFAEPISPYGPCMSHTLGTIARELCQKLERKLIPGAYIKGRRLNTLSSGGNWNCCPARWSLRSNPNCSGYIHSRVSKTPGKGGDKVD